MDVALYCLILKISIMKKYIVIVQINKVEEKRSTTTQYFDFQFESGNLIKDRKMAIKKAKDVLENIEDFLGEGEFFSSPYEARLNNYRNYNCFSITIYLACNDGGYDDLSPIYGADDEESFDWLEHEANVFRDLGLDVKFKIVENFEGDYVKVLSSQLKFILN